MPLIECTLIEGYDADTRRLVSERITDAACSAIGASPDFVIVTIKEVAPENYMRGRSQKTPAPAALQPDEIVKKFLTSMQDQQLDDAQKWLADGAQMIFPNGQCFTDLSDLMAWTKTRYQSVLKTFERIETTFKSQDASVYCYGTLQGVSLDGRPFENIRFIDRFAISNGKITQQEVWNDLAQAEVVKNEII
ncbi:tautomerase family protein [Paracoccaceae bacterium]|jgi:phenylpyruvate tautomerase PptA (4-oxalocrotonate tautomerase family)|nr:tautomerase family protein [Paracoccaceae bacterium]|tara:strand:+ start:419 stop:994 length:576 start_codon:yes stop_codon:yes gene_type:complete